MRLSELHQNLSCLPTEVIYDLLMLFNLAELFYCRRQAKKQNCQKGPQETGVVLHWRQQGGQLKHVSVWI